MSHQVKKVKARKEHQCTFCRQGIAKEEVHILVQKLSLDIHDRNYWFSYRQHVDCHKRFEEIQKKNMFLDEENEEFLEGLL